MLESNCSVKCGTQDSQNSATKTLSSGNRPNSLSKISADRVSSMGRSPYRLFHCHADMCQEPGHGSRPHAAAMFSLYQFSVMWKATVPAASCIRAHIGPEYGSAGERQRAGPGGSAS